MYPNIFISGPSGSGKSTSLRNLDPERTIIINTERKQLPFRAAGRFKKQIMVGDLHAFNKALERAASSADSDIIVIDSFSSLAEQVHQHAKSIKKGFDIWACYADTLHDILQQTKSINKFVVFTGIDEPLQDSDGTVTRHVRVDGKALKGSIEKEFTCVLWAQVLNEGGAIRHCFETNNDGRTTAKTPLEMFSERYIDNDLNIVINTIKEYYA